MTKYIFPLLVVATMFVADSAFGAGNPQGPKGGMPTQSQAAANSNGIRSLDRERGLARAAERRNVRSLAKSHGRHLAKQRVYLR